MSDVDPISRAALLQAGRQYLDRWTKYLQNNPDADPVLIQAAMERGDPPPSEKKKSGRPTKLTADTHQIIVTAISKGLYYEDAANLAGITYDTLNNWRKRGETEAERRDNPRVKSGTRMWKAEEPFFKFFEACKKAEGKAMLGWMEKIDAAMDEHWQAAAWKAERRYPERYSRQRIEHTGADGRPIQTAGTQRVDYVEMSDDDLYDTFRKSMGAITEAPTRETGEAGRSSGESGEGEGTDAAD